MVPPPPPVQAGRFKPRVPRKKPTAVSVSVAAPSATNANAASSSSSGRSPRSGGGRGGRGGRGGGRGGRGRGRGRGRIPLPKGQVFFTGNATRQEGAGATGPGMAMAATLEASKNDKKGSSFIAPGLDGSVLMPGMSSLSMKASGAGRLGEGEEVVVGEIAGGGVGSKDQMTDGPEGILARTKLGEGGTFGDEEDIDDGHLEPGNEGAYTFDSDSSAEHTEQKLRRAKQKEKARYQRGGGPMEPYQLPFPIPKPTSHLIPRQVMYECQETTLQKEHEDEKIMKRKKRLQQQQKDRSAGRRIIKDDSDSDEDNNNAQTKPNLIIHEEGQDPPLYSPFLPTTTTTAHASSADITSTSFVEQRKERDSWMLFKFPTRLPRIHPQSTISGMVYKSEKMAEEAIINSILATEGGGGDGMDTDMDMGHDESDNPNADKEQMAQMVAAQTAAETAANLITSKNRSGGRGEGYDDTLKDIAAGRYGKIVIYKSGKMEFVMGDGESDKSDEVGPCQT